MIEVNIIVLGLILKKKYMYLFIYISIFIRYEIMKKIIRDNFL